MSRVLRVAVAVAIGIAGFIVATVLLFLVFDRRSHSASDTIRPFLITAGPLWLATFGGIRLLLRSSDWGGR